MKPLQKSKFQIRLEELEKSNRQNINPIVLKPVNISLSVVPIRRTIKWTDEEGFNHVKRNQLAVRVNFTGTYDTEFAVGNILFDWENNQRFVAVSKNVIVNALEVAEKFTIPSKVICIASAYVENSIKP